MLEKKLLGQTLSPEREHDPSPSSAGAAPAGGPGVAHCLPLLGSEHRASSCCLADSRGLPELWYLDHVSEAKEIQSQVLGMAQLPELRGSFLGAAHWRRDGSKREMLESARHASWFAVKRSQTARDSLP